MLPRKELLERPLLEVLQASGTPRSRLEASGHRREAGVSVASVPRRAQEGLTRPWGPSDVSGYHHPLSWP